jgi:hypothetical protein
MKVAGLGLEDILARIEDFHGHLGPFVILGFRAGQAALRSLPAQGYFDLEARVWCGKTPPLSCFADGVQLGSGCTTGKGNLTVAADDEGLAARVEFRTRPVPGSTATPPGPARLGLVVRPEVAAKAGKWLEELGDRGAAYRLLELDDRELFET